MACYTCENCNEFKDDDFCVGTATKNYMWICEDCLPEIEGEEDVQD